MKKDRKPIGYWDIKENCAEEAKKYKTRTEFQKGCISAAKAAKRHGWDKEFFGDTVFKPAGYWDIKENCLEEAKKYKTRTEFRDKNQPAYKSTRENKWLDECTWFLSEFEARSKGGYGKRRKHTEQDCYEAAKRFTCKSDFMKYARPEYKAAKRYGWYDTYTWFVTPKPQKHEQADYVVYVYKIEETHSVYVGLTDNIQIRHRAHKNGKSNHGVREYDRLKKHCVEHGIEVPMPTIVMDELDAENAQYHEDWYRKGYANQGWNVINYGNTGIGTSSLGGTYRKYTDEEIIAEAEKYDTPMQFKDGNISMYRAMYRHHLQDKIQWKKDWKESWRENISKKMKNRIPWNKGMKNCQLKQTA